jgi:pilus assembly protein Flp/PilA
MVVGSSGSASIHKQRPACRTLRLKERGQKMKSMFDSVKTFLVSEDGPTAVEYAVMLALIIIVCLTAIKAVGTTANDRFTDVKNALTP